MEGILQSRELLHGIRELIREEFKNEGLLKEPWRFRKIDEVLSPTKVKCFVDGSDTSIVISCNPDVLFRKNDEVWIVNTARDNKSRFVLCKRF
ncbi:hypothetical protein BRE01_64260 [Brevibacillus reuszeri]|uniref:Uncharacterized protein n=1 Tax=Brevibacillus reuszeri TaxID=54915 RepID=A0A0K9YW17_9BACL|nr:hypothetical protein [Brevibacillus reuszeri]KNB72919.1 hypothetical protein ADS79_13910 [Brevibacillus reuszeri]MED1861714.1 hypothetical protein [Brevibacillus reuszeri]GED72724.1 hypothetical protein BRE01_64260 [Brevibacillus reuszeri]